MGYSTLREGDLKQLEAVDGEDVKIGRLLVGRAELVQEHGVHPTPKEQHMSSARLGGVSGRGGFRVSVRARERDRQLWDLLSGL